MTGMRSWGTRGGGWPRGEDDEKGEVGGRQDGGDQSAHLRRIGGGGRVRRLHLLLPVASSTRRPGRACE